MTPAQQAEIERGRQRFVNRTAIVCLVYIVACLIVVYSVEETEVMAFALMSWGFCWSVMAIAFIFPDNPRD